MESGSERKLDERIGDAVEIPAVAVEEVVIRPGNLMSTTYVDMVQLGKGCSEACLSCGAYDGTSGPVMPITLDRLRRNLAQEFAGGHSPHDRFQVHDLLSSSVTTGVDMEPLDRGIFVEAARLIYQLTKGRSRMVCITHGVKLIQRPVTLGVESELTWGEFDPEQGQNLNEIKQLLMDEIVPEVVLSVDSARAMGLMGRGAESAHKGVLKAEDDLRPFLTRMGINAQIAEGKLTEDTRSREAPDVWQDRLEEIKKNTVKLVLDEISRGSTLNEQELLVQRYVCAKEKLDKIVIEANARSYAETIHILMPAVNKAKSGQNVITISPQGEEDRPDSLVYIGLATKIWQKTVNILTQEYGYDPALFSRGEYIRVQPPRPYVPEGRAEKIMRKNAPYVPCDVNPDSVFVQQGLGTSSPRVMRGMLESDGTLFVQQYIGGQTYSYTVNPEAKGRRGALPNLWKRVDLDVITREFKERVETAASQLAGERVCIGIPAEGEEGSPVVVFEEPDNGRKK